MNVASYLFQSPYSSPVQVGRVDPSTKQEDTKKKEAKPQQSALNVPDTNQKLQEARSFATSQIKGVSPAVEAPKLLDTYA